MNRQKSRWGIAVALVVLVSVFGGVLLAGTLGGTRSAASTIGVETNTSTDPAGSSGTVPSTTATTGGPTLTVSATGTANGTPDTVTIDIGASTTAQSASDALSRNDAEMAHLESLLTAAGAKSSDLTTSGLDLNPNYGPANEITGYEADDTLTVTLHDPAAAGSVIDAATGAVGNDIRLNGITFSISDTSALLKAARLQAMQMAATEAGNLVGGTSDTLGPIVSITDNEQNQAPPVNVFARSAAASASPVPLQAGSEAVSVNVQVVYSLISPTS